MVRAGETLHLSQAKYIRDLLAHAGLAKSKPIATPMASGSVVSLSNGAKLAAPDRK